MRGKDQIKAVKHQNSKKNTSTPLLRDIFIMLGRAQCKVLSCVDLKEAFHSLPLTSETKELCGILPYFGSPHFRYEVLPMGLVISPQVWIDYIENILCGMANKQDYIAIMDDLLIHGFKGNHLDRLEDLFQAMIKHGLTFSPKKCQLFMKQSRQPHFPQEGHAGGTGCLCITGTAHGAVTRDGRHARHGI